MKVLITAGGTREAIDGVRFLTNFSTGSTGATIADFFAREGHAVTYFRGAGSATSACRDTEEFTDFESLDALLRERLGRESYDGVIHLAAVSDFSLDRMECGNAVYDREEIGRLGKISSAGEEGLVLRLKKNPKIVDRIRGYARISVPKIVAFKLTNTGEVHAREAAVARLYAGSGADWIVHNDFSEVKEGDASRNFRLYAAGRLHTECAGVGALARILALCLQAEVV